VVTISRRWMVAALALVLAACTGTNNTPTATPGPAATRATPAATTRATTSVTPSQPTATASARVAPTPGATASASGRLPPSPGASAVAGSIAIADAAAVDPISRAVAAALGAGDPGIAATFSTDETFASFCAGQVDAYGAVRKIKARGEADVCANNNVDYVELRIALDAVAVVTSAQNADLVCLGFPDLYALLGPESTGFTNWKDANSLAATLGSGAEFADQPLTVAGPPADADASALLIDAIIAPIAAQRSQTAGVRSDYQASPDSTAVISTVANPASGAATLGWLPYSVAAANADQVKILRLDGGDGCINPSVDKVLSGAYPTSRSLYLYVNLDKADANPALAAYVDAYMGPDTLATALQTLPYLPLPDDVLQESRFAWQGR